MDDLLNIWFKDTMVELIMK